MIAGAGGLLRLRPWGATSKKRLRLRGGQSSLRSARTCRNRFILGSYLLLGRGLLFKGHFTSPRSALVMGRATSDFIFDITTDQGSDKLLDFDSLVDRLCVIGIDLPPF